MLIEQVPNIEYFEIAWLTMLKKQVLRTGTQDQLAGKTFHNFSAASRTALRSVLEQQVKFLQDVWLNQQEYVFC